VCEDLPSVKLTGDGVGSLKLQPAKKSIIKHVLWLQSCLECCRHLERCAMHVGVPEGNELLLPVLAHCKATHSVACACHEKRSRL